MNVSMRRAAVRAAVSGFVTFCALIGGAPAGFAQETVARYVLADVVRVREAPETGAKVIANLRIATPVKVAAGGAAPEGWSKVLLDTAPPLTGYVASAFLGLEAPGIRDLHAAELRLPTA